MITKLLKYNEMFNNQTLMYFSFDIDDNLVYMPTKIHMEYLDDNGEWITIPVSTEQFAVIRGDKEHWRFKPGEESFEEFRDWGPDGSNTFLIQFKYAVEHNKFAPSWSKFIECLVNGYLFSIITSRGHHPKNVKKAIEWLIYDYGLDKFKNLKLKNVDNSESFEDQMITNLLSYHDLFGSEPDYVIDQYLDLCPIYTVSSPYFKQHYGDLSAEEAKKLSLRDFTKIVNEYADQLNIRAKLGFSDDDPIFVKSAVDEFTELMKTMKNIDYSVFNTGGRRIKKIDL